MAASTSTQALSDLQSFQSGMTKPDQAYQQAGQQLGVPAAQQQVQGLRGAINSTTSLLQQVAPSVMGRTQNSLVTSAQAGRQIQNEQAPIQTDLARENQDYTGASQDYNTLLNQANTQAGANLQGQQGQLSYLQQLYQTLSGNEQKAQDFAEQQRQFNADQAYKQQALKASSAASAGASGVSLGGSSSGANGTLGRDASGGYKITNSSGAPITLGQYAAANGLGIAQISQLLMQSGNPNDQKIAASINSNKYTSTQLRQMFPQALGGSY